MMTELRLLGQAVDRLRDALTESPDETTEVWGPAEIWPSWCDDVVIALGPAWSRAECFDDSDPLPGELALTDAATIEDLKCWERPVVMPEDEDHWTPIRATDAKIEALLDLQERERYEAGCNAHWAP